MKTARDNTTRALSVALPLLVVFGFVATDWLRFLVQSSLATSLVVLGVMLQMRAGLVSFGQGLYFCLGAYVAGMLGYLWGVTDAFLLLVLGGGACVALAWVLGHLLSRYRDIFYANFCLALSMILWGLLVKVEALGSTDGFNVPHPSFLGYAPTGEALSIVVFTLTCAVVYGVAWVLHRYLASTYGHIGDAIHQNEIRVEYLGASVREVIHKKYILAAAVSGLGGVLMAISVGHVDPDLAYWTTSGEFVFIVLLSGMGNVIAPIIGTFLLELLRTYAFEYAPYTWQMIVGVAMLIIILFLPGGLWSLYTLRRSES